MHRPGNPYFARSIVNRVWASYFNVGIIEPADDLNLANPPSNAELLDYLSHAFVEHHYDLKWLHREITNSRTYQLSWRPNDTNRLDERNFSRAMPRRLPAEVAYDAVQQATATDAEIGKMQTDISQRMIGQAGGGGKGKKGNNNYALQIFGKSLRESNCDCDRSMEPSLLQTIYLHNDNDTLASIERSGWIAEVLKVSQSKPAEKNPGSESPAAKSSPDLATVEAKLQKASAAGDKDRIAKLEKRLANLRRKEGNRPKPETEVVVDDELNEKSVRQSFDREAVIRQAYLRTLGRPPGTGEIERAMLFIEESSSPAAGLRGLLWALLNTKEFIVNH
jgi:hypothetical protein